MDCQKKVTQDPDGAGDPLVEAVQVQGTPQGKATCPKAGEDMMTQVSLPVTATENKEGWKERKKKKRKEKRKAMGATKTGISPLRRTCAPELGEGSSAGERRGRDPVQQESQTHAGGPAGGGEGAIETPLRVSAQERLKRKREPNTGSTPEMRPVRRPRQGAEDGRTYAQATRRQAAIVAKGGGYLTKEQADIIRGRLRRAVKDYLIRQRSVKPMAQPRVLLRFRDAGWMPPGFLLVTCHDQVTEEWLAQWSPGELDGEPLEVALGSNIPWPRKVCIMIKDEVKPDPEAVREDIILQNEVQAETWISQGVEEMEGMEGEDGRKQWIITYMIPAASLRKLQAQDMEVFYELLAIRVYRPRGRRGKTYLAGPKEEGRSQTETGESTSDSDSS